MLHFQKQSSERNLHNENFGNAYETLVDTLSKCTCIRKARPYQRGIEVVLVPCIHLNILSVSVWHPLIRRRTFSTLFGNRAHASKIWRNKEKIIIFENYLEWRTKQYDSKICTSPIWKTKKRSVGGIANMKYLGI